MTDGEWDGWCALLPQLEAQAILRLAQGALYPHVGQADASRLWDGWQRQAYPRAQEALVTGGREMAARLRAWLSSARLGTA